MKTKKLAKDVVPGDRLYLDDGTNPMVSASYALGSRWALDVPGRMVQVDGPEAEVIVFEK